MLESGIGGIRLPATPLPCDTSRMTDIPRYPTLHMEVPPDDVDEASAALFELGASGDRKSVV